MLEGGYDLEALAGSVAALMEGLEQGGPSGDVGRHALADAAAQRLGRYWEL